MEGRKYDQLRHVLFIIGKTDPNVKAHQIACMAEGVICEWVVLTYPRGLDIDLTTDQGMVRVTVCCITNLQQNRVRIDLSCAS